MNIAYSPVVYDLKGFVVLVTIGKLRLYFRRSGRSDIPPRHTFKWEWNWREKNKALTEKLSGGWDPRPGPGWEPQK